MNSRGMWEPKIKIVPKRCKQSSQCLRDCWAGICSLLKAVGSWSMQTNEPMSTAIHSPASWRMTQPTLWTSSLCIIQSMTMPIAVPSKIPTCDTFVCPWAWYNLLTPSSVWHTWAAHLIGQLHSHYPPVISNMWAICWRFNQVIRNIWNSQCMDLDVSSASLQS